jgi:hypothetical protein
MNLIAKRDFLESPERKRFGWSGYVEKIISFDLVGEKVLAQKATIQGKKLCLFRKFIWTYEIGVLDYKSYFIK